MTDQHLTADELVDLAEGTTREAVVPHLAACASCRQQLADLRAAMAMAANVEVPEPPPFFWNRFSSQVREAVANDVASRRGWRRWLSWPGVMAPVSAAVAAAIVFFVVSAPHPAVSPQDGSGPSALQRGVPSTVDLLNDSVGDDASLDLVAALTAALGWDAAADAGLAPDGSAEHAIAHLNASELQQLKRLLQEELAGKGA